MNPIYWVSNYNLFDTDVGVDVDVGDNAFVMLLQLLCYKMSKLEILPRRSLMEEDQSVRSVFLLSLS